MNEPRYSKGQHVRILHDWAKDLPPQIIDNAVWDDHWNCYTYALVGASIRIEEHELAQVPEEPR